ncbi:MAG TPA: hypothetical protein DET40_01220 [Lentisphaeria bacterium]|nr:MAG: hypothetical protein A2X45_12660 [Lentisphaerae bacterium GWF2_50_93]HCE42152.1 hypothetical protein [Lentisphaeria bacterium]
MKLKICSSFIVFLVLVMPAGLVRAEPLDEAKKLMASRSYSEVDKVLERELAESNPRPEVLKISYEAAMGGAQFVTAERRMAVLLKQTQNNDLDLLYQGAACAELIGDQQMAMARYSMYVQKCNVKSDKLEHALIYILVRGTYPEEYRKFVQLHGAGSAWTLGATLLERLCQAPDPENALKTALFLEQQFPEPGNVNFIHWRLRMASESFELGKEPKNRFVKPLMVMAEAVPSDYSHITWMFQQANGSLTPQERSSTILKIQSGRKKPMGGWLNELFFSMRDIKEDDVRLAAGKSFLALEPVFRDSANRDDYHLFMRVISESPGVFALSKDKPETNLIPVADIQKKFELLKQKYADSPQVLRGVLQNIQNGYVPGDKTSWMEYLKKNIAILSTSQLNDLMAASGGANVSATLAEYAKGNNYKDVLDARIGLMPWFSKSKEPDAAQQLLTAAREYMRAYPTSFDWKKIRSSFINSQLITFDQKVALLKEQVAMEGYNPIRSELLKDMAADKDNWANKQAFLEIIKDHNAKAPGTDTMMRGLTAMTKAATDKPKEAHDAAKQFLDEYKGQVPGGWEKTANLEGVQAMIILNREMELSWNNGNDISRVVEQWAPRISLGSTWDNMVRRAREHGRTGTLAKIAPIYIALTKNDPGSQAVWSELPYLTVAKKDYTNPLAEVYPKLGTDRAAWHVLNNREAWEGNRQFFIEQATKAIAGTGGKFTDWNIAVPMIHQLYNISNPQNKVPPEVTQHLWNFLISAENKSSSYDVTAETFCYGQIARSGGDTKPFIATYLAEIRKRRPDQQIEAISCIFRHVNLPAEPVDKELKPGMRYHTIAKMLKPAFDKVPAYSLARMSISQNLYLEVENLARNAADASVKADAVSLGCKMVEMLVDGAQFEGDARNIYGLVDLLCRREIESGNWKAASQLLASYAILLGRSSNWDDNYQRVAPIITLLESRKANEMIYVFISTIERHANPTEKIRSQLSVIKAKVGSEIKDMIPVDKTDPMYNLFVAAQALSFGNEARAWELTSAKLPLLQKEWVKLDPEYVAWVADQMRKQKMYTPSLELAMTMLLREKEMNPEIAARASLTKGDTYRDMGNYQAAKIEYDGLRNNPAYNRTVAGAKSYWRLVDLLITTKDYTTATGLLERMVDSDKIETQAEAYYYFARMAYQEQQYKEAKEYIKKVKDRVVNHVEAAFLEGELNLVLPGGLQNQEVMVGNPRLALTVIPGRVLTLKLQDQNLSVARGGASIPVVITTSNGMDEEHVKLLPSSTNKNLFVGQINTALGNVQKNDTLLQLRGSDVVSYEIEKEFQKANDLNYSAKTLEVRYDARLAASSGEILSEEEEEKRAMERQIRKTQQQDEETMRYEANRDNRSVRPGSPIFVQVTDFARDVGDSPDTVPVDLKTSSGDVIEGFKLLETGPHTGIFRASVLTGIPLPKATTSDGPEGKDPSCLINSAKTDKWVSIGDGKKPKWVEVDTMSSQLVKTCSLEVPDPAAFKQMKFMGILADRFEELAAFPPKDLATIKGGLAIDFANDQRGEQPDAIRRYLSLAAGAPLTQDKTTLDRDDTPLKGRDVWQTSRMCGSFWLPENRSLEFKFLQTPCNNGGWQHSYIFIDGQYVLGGEINKDTVRATKKIDLVKGAHRLEVLDRCHWKSGKVTVGYRKDDGTFEPLPASWFSIKDNPALADYLKPKGTVKINGNLITATLAEPVRLRKIRWEFGDFIGNSVAVNKVNLVNDQGKAVLPTSNDFSSGLANGTLEIAPGDQVTVSYRNEKRLREDTPVLESMLNATFFNGNVILANESITKRNGSEERIYQYSPAKRCRRGDSLMLIVTDYDGDITKERDTLPVKVTTSGGEKLELKALETWTQNPSDLRSNHAGVFMAIIRIGDVTKDDQIKVNPGDQLAVSYLDTENTEPGVPVERIYSVNEAGASRPEFVVYKTNLKQVLDTSEEARAKLQRMRTRNPEKSLVYKDITLATHPDYETKDAAPAAPPAAPGAAEKPAQPATGETIVAVNAPLLFELNYPRMALNAGSILKVEAVSDSEEKASKKENRKPNVLAVPMYIEGIQKLADVKGYTVQLQSHIRRTAEEMLRDGSFAGVIRLQIGSPGDPVNDLVLRGERAFASQEQRKQDKEEFSYRVPTLIVAGSDTVTLKVKDDADKVLSESRVRLLSDGRLELMDPSYQIQKDAVHLGEKFSVRVTDPDHDISNDQDKVNVDVSTSSGDMLKLELTETLSHSGVFTGTVKPEFIGEKVDGKSPVINTKDDQLSVNFGDEVVFVYNDGLTLSGRPARIEVKGTIYPGSDALMSNFSKQFKDPEMAVKTNFLMAEALFEMAKEHRKLKQADVAKDEIDRGKRILQEAMRDYANTTLAAQGEFLLANLAQELESYQEAIGRYSHVINTWPESEYAARSQFKKAICMEKMEQYELACEEYVKVTYVYPDSSLVADATVRMGNYYYKKEAYKVAGQIFHKFKLRNPAHQLAPKALFLAAQCYYKMKDFKEAIKLFTALVEEYTEQKDVREEAMYWLGDSHFNNGDPVRAYQTFKKLTWDYPEGRWAKIARGRLTEEAFSKIEENQ